MNQIERIELIKAVFKRLYARFEKATKSNVITSYSMDRIRGVAEGLDDSVMIMKMEEKDQLENEKISHIIGRRLLFSKRMAMCRMFRHWYHSKPEYIGYNTDMFFISYLDKKGWLNTQKIMDQMTDSRIRAILGEVVADKLIIDDKKENSDEI